ncbi:acyl-CoA dehydrogenase family protein [Achromobacter xylosoxidans]|uniref:acyl-CoA dehydrogenase family protein n=1 Tax=Alcaligenes xylosoxydans xylosoxydans TaxID=85698 RepID=UPI0006C52EEF|nr:acyl-CoA dehydrogenase family protein [Achromobacter xylosoxidans]MDH0519883.1 acyl-CoA dehydrogenase family protein [Achromobacter xylosoxidans]MDH0544488.1 acyl-CoA dehydrogenase family protein [Achromobacter xylosoxidans]CUI99561.1 sulfur acquisition oxidoreductase%2C SfnB family [Achromobacter xylosoxidans]
MAKIHPHPDTDRAPATGAAPARAADTASAVQALAEQLAATAVERDRQGGHAAAERERIRASGLLRLSVPTQYGGAGASWSTVLAAVRTLAEADSALAHVFGFHHLQVAGVLLYGTPEQHAYFLKPTVERNLFWGNALNPLDRRVVARPELDGYRIDGVKNFSSGSVGSDLLTFSAWHKASDTALIAALPTRAEGITVNPDWDAFGQRQTDSGTVRFDHVRLEPVQVLQAPGVAPTPRATLRSQVAQLIMTNLYLGIACGAFREARRYVRDDARPWFASGVQRHADDPYVQERFGEFWLRVQAAQALADLAGQRLDAALARGPSLTADERGEVAVAGAQAKVLAHRAALEVGNGLFDVTGASSTAARYGYDRYWRNARVHTLHDPVAYKIRDLGRYALLDQIPEPTAYS